MRYEAFREWLRGRGGNPSSVNTRSGAVRKLERELAALGIPQTDLDAAYDADHFGALRQMLDDMRVDTRGGCDRFKILFPQSGEPLSRIANTRAWLGQYGQFLSGAAHSDALSLNAEDPYWFVGASFGQNDDQTERFVRDGIWEIDNPKPQNAEAVRSMQVGDRIAIKAVFVRRLDLPFDNRNQNVSVMRIKARGTITENPGTGDSIQVAWDEEFAPRDWYFYTHRPTIWEIRPGHKAMGDKLIAFAFFDEEQDIDWFRNQADWAKTLGDAASPMAKRFWIEKTIVSGREDRESGDHALGQALWSPQTSKDGKNIYATMLQVHPGDIIFHLTDNAAISSVSVAREAANAGFICLDGSEWAGQPGYRIALSDHATLAPSLPRAAFLDAEPYAAELKELAASGAKGLFYNRSRGLNQGAYLTEATPTLLSILNRAYENYAGKSLPYVTSTDAPVAETKVGAYTLEDALKELFIDQGTAEDIMLLWSAKKNIIIQGPPGVGKSFAAQRLAFALMGAEDRSRLGFVQFHQSYSYEDFVEGFRPTATGFELQPGKFVEFCRRAEADPQRRYVFVIDEINRGNLSKILGELMLLIESDKREPRWAMPLASGKAPFHVPANVFIMGLMNTADRSLAVVEYALRRRFAFVDLAPNLQATKFRALLEGFGISGPRIDSLIERIGLLNAQIVEDIANLGPGFAIGHSFFCAGLMGEEEEDAWYARVIRTEIVPLLREYWFDAPDKADDWKAQLLAPL